MFHLTLNLTYIENILEVLGLSKLVIDAFRMIPIMLCLALEHLKIAQVTTTQISLNLRNQLNLRYLATKTGPLFLDLGGDII